jgi:hypothetical protein
LTFGTSAFGALIHRLVGGARDLRTMQGALITPAAGLDTMTSDDNSELPLARMEAR